jgi:hypothetical protein
MLTNYRSRVIAGSVGLRYELGSPHAIDVSISNPGLMNVEARAATAGYQLAQRPLKGQLVWWWQWLDDPDDTRHPCWWNVVRPSRTCRAVSTANRLAGPEPSGRVAPSPVVNASVQTSGPS